MPRRKSSNLLPEESSVFVSESPVASIKQKGNLTGNVRVVREHVYDIRDSIDKWNTVMIEGMKIVSTIKDVMHQKLSDLTSNSINCINDLQKHSMELQMICNKMNLIVVKLSQKSMNMCSLSKLEEKYTNTKPLFLTWPAKKFAQVCQNIYDMYKRELEFKIAIKEQICFCCDDSSVDFLEIAWLQQPFLEKNVEIEYELMLIEVGHAAMDSSLGVRKSGKN